MPETAIGFILEIVMIHDRSSHADNKSEHKGEQR